MTLAFTIALSQPTYVRGDSIIVSLALSNAGTQAVELPAPLLAGRCSYTLTPPAGRELRENGPVLLNPPGSASPSAPATDSDADEDEGDVEPPPPVKRLAPGERWTGLVALDRLFPIGDEGRYRIAARISWKDLQLEAAAQEFKVEDLRVLQMSRGSSSAPQEGEASLLLLRALDPDRALVFSPLTLDADRDAVPRLGAPSELRKLPKEAVDPVESSSVSGLELFWSFWREGSTLFGLRGAAKTPRRLALPGAVERMVEPALLDGGSVTHVYGVCVKDDARKLVVARFMDYLEDPVNPERILAEIPLQARPLDAAAFIDTVKGQPRRVVALGRIDGKSPRVDWISYLGESVPAAFRSQVWAKSGAVEALDDSRPAVDGLSEGGVRIAWVVREAGQPTRGLLCEATFDESGALKTESTTPLTAAGPIKAARAVHVSGVPVVALWTQDGQVVGGKGAELPVVIEKSPGRIPPTLLVLRTTSYVVDFDPVKGLVLVPVR